MNNRLVGRRGAYSLVVVLLLFAIGLPALAWTGLLSATDQAGKEPAAATDRGTPERLLDQPAVVEGAFQAEASVAREQAEDRSAEKAVAEKAVAERGAREEDQPDEAAGNADAEKADAEGAVEEAVAAEGEIPAGRGGIAAEPAVDRASAPAEASASASAS